MTIIRKSFIGYIYRVFYAVAVVALLILFLWIASDYGTQPLEPMLVPAVALFLALVGLILLASLYLYSLSYIKLDVSGITVQQWTTFLSDSNAETQWYRVTSVDSEQIGLLSRIFGYGTLVVQQAGTQQPITMTMVPNVDYWKDLIQDRVSTSPAPVHEV